MSKLGELVRKSLFTRGTIAVFVLVLLGTWAFESPGIRAQLPILTTCQLWFHQWLAKLDFREHKVKWVALVEIDDDTFWGPPFSGVQPTNRGALADLVAIAEEAKAEVIALDFSLTSPTRDGGDAAERAGGNEHLVKTIKETMDKGVPVVLGTPLVDDGSGHWARWPNIYDGKIDPPVRVGFLNLPRDKRHIPLQMRVGDEQQGEMEDSLALEIVQAYEDYKNINPRTAENSVLHHARSTGEFIFGGFIDPVWFTRISGKRLLARDSEAMKNCQGRIVIVGGTWHSGGKNMGPLVESFPSPVGSVPGLYLHANYVEALMDPRFTAPVPVWVGLILDLVIGIALYLSFHALKGTAGRLAILALFAIPLGCAYVAFANLGRYLEFILPLGLLFLHLGYEHYMSLSDAKDPDAPHAPAVVPAKPEQPQEVQNELAREKDESSGGGAADVGASADRY